ncbi:MAG TPA: TIGR04053 family radical SAM/SPASM domain-containing protein [Acidimicrobiales bacterium]|jgi:radical SAM protein|nr:TIGR04053 family radical SAM/SPASM domain-containing protein [Acidimicrobiales bacterium]
MDSRVKESSEGQFDRRPLLVFWEMTKACQLSCFHCRANAQFSGGPEELSTREGIELIDSIASLGKPRPILILTGGDCLMREDIVELATYAHSLNVPVAIAPSVTEKLTSSTLEGLRRAGVKSASLSLDGANASTHDAVRGVPGHFDATLRAIAELNRHGFTTQVNTTVMASNVRELADVAQIVQELKVNVWEVFFLITTGRGSEIEATSATVNEEVCHFLVNASRYGFTVRTVEAPFFRRVALERRQRSLVGDPQDVGETYEFLRSRLLQLLGPSSAVVRAPSAATRDGKGIIFVGANGDIYPSGFLPIALGNVRSANLIDVYRDHDLLQSIRSADFVGPCHSCQHSDLCGGSRSRAYAAYANPLASDPGCVLVSSSSR